MILRDKINIKVGALICASIAVAVTGVVLGGRPVHADQRANGGVPTNPIEMPKGDLGFMENKGQWDDQALFYAGLPGMDVWVKNSGLKYDFYQQSTIGIDHKLGMASLKPATRSGHVIELEFLGSRPQAEGAGKNRLPGLTNFIRNGRTASGVGMFEEASVQSLYDGVDMRVYKDGGRPRFDLNVAPNFDLSQIRFAYKGAYGVRIGTAGEVRLSTRYGEVAVTDLKAFQEGPNGKSPVDCAYKSNGDGTFGFTVGNYDHSKMLIIDPVVYSTLFGGFAQPPFIPGHDIARAVVVDRLNIAYITGSTNCPFFPITNGVYDNTVSGQDAFVTKFRRDATGIIFSTVIGGTGTETGLGIAVDSLGRVCIAGATNSQTAPITSGFPTTQGAPQRLWGGGFDSLTGVPLNDGFCARLSANGATLEFGTYIGGNGDTFPDGNDVAYGIGVDGSDNMYVAGQAESLNFPTTANALINVPQGGRDGFVIRYSPVGDMDYGTFLGGSGSDTIRGIAVDPAGFAHVTGGTTSTNFPTTVGAFDRSVQQGDAFVSKLAPTGDNLEFSTSIGGSASDASVAIAIDSQGNSYICGSSQSVDFPRTLGCYDDIFTPDFENFVTKVALDGASLVYSTFMNGGGTQTGIGVDDQGIAHICGYVIPGVLATTATGDDRSYNGPNPPNIGDAYLQALNQGGSDLFYGSYFGGSLNDAAFGIAIDQSRNAYFVGMTNSSNDQAILFPTTAGVFKPQMSNDNFPNPAFWDCFLVKAKVRPAPIVQSFVITDLQLAGTETTNATITLSAPAGPGGAVILLSSDREAVARADDNAGGVLPSITIDEGQTTGTFPIATSDVTQTFTVNFTAELEGDLSHASVTVAPWLTSLSLSPSVITGGLRVTGRVVLYRPAPASGMKVDITTGDASVAYAIDPLGDPTTVIDVPAGQLSTTFTIVTRGVPTDRTVAVLARISTPSLEVVRSQDLRLVAAKIKSLTFAPLHVNGGERSIGTITLDGEAGGPIRFVLSLGSGTAPVTVQSLVTVGARTNSIQFYANTSFVSSNQFRNVIATRQSDPAQFKQGTLFVDTNNLSSIVLSAAQATGGTLVTGNVRLVTPAITGGFGVNVSTNNSAIAPLLYRVPGTNADIEVSAVDLRVSSGSIQSPTFRIKTKASSTNTLITLTASKPGYASKTATLLVKGITLSISMTPGSVIGGLQNVTGTVSVAENTTTPLVVNLTSDNPSALSVPTTSIILLNSRERSFIAISHVVLASTNVTVTASLPGVPGPLTATSVVTVTIPIPTLVSLTFSPSTVIGGNNSIGTITLEKAAPLGGITVLLTKDPNATGSDFCSVPGTVVVTAGARIATFVVTTTRPARLVATTVTADIGPQSPTVSAVLNINRT